MLNAAIHPSFVYVYRGTPSSDQKNAYKMDISDRKLSEKAVPHLYIPKGMIFLET